MGECWERLGHVSLGNYWRFPPTLSYCTYLFLSFYIILSVTISVYI